MSLHRHIAHTKDPKASLFSLYEETEIRDDAYVQNFHNLNSKIQERFIEFLYSLNIPPDIGLIVDFLSMNKEQRLYAKWLKELRNIEQI
jgi:hypothetical protein